MKKQILFIFLITFCCTYINAQWKLTSPCAPELNIFFNKIDSQNKLSVIQKPTIGISLGVNPNKNTVNNDYVNSVIKAGGIPYLIPVTEEMETLKQIVSQLDGILFTGGEDIQPKFYSEEKHPKLEELNPLRDNYDFLLFKLAKDRNIPILGICRGLQLINVAMGGTLYQDIPSQKPSDVQHRQNGDGKEPIHSVTVLPNSKAYEIVKRANIKVNSFHHQGIKQLAPGLKITGKAPDGMPEIIESYPLYPILGVQFHPEIFTGNGDTLMLKFFKFLINKADTFRLAKNIHERILSIDTHTDAPMWYHKGYSIGLRKDNRVSIQKMEEGKLDAQFLAAFLSQKERDSVSLQKAVDKTFGLLYAIHNDIKKYSAYCGLARTEEDLIKLKKEGKKAFFIGIENGYGIGKDIANIAKFKKLGVNYITLCHTSDNDICNSSSKTADASKGLTPFGRKVVKEMNRLGIMVDISHVSEGTFWDVIQLSTQPIIASHSSAKACRFHDRNLTDEQLRALAKNGGVVQVCFYSSFLNRNKKEASILDIIRHINHIVKIAGIDHVGIGSDFDGGGGVPGCNGDNDLINITVKLLEEGYSEEDIRKIWGGNFFRVMNQVQKSGEF